MIIKSFKPSMRELAPYIIAAVESGSDVRLTLTGYSMYPILRGGSDDIILTKPETIKKYDVVLFKRENGDYIFHRVIKTDGDILTIAGDNEIVKEYPVYTSSVVAKMKSFIRNGKLYTNDNIWYKIYSRLWLFIFPLRHIATFILHNTAVVCRKLK